MHEPKQNRQRSLRILCCALSAVLCLLWLGFIFSNSLKSGSESGEQSSKVYEAINEIAQNMGITQEIPEGTIRSTAHFTEFTVLGLLVGLTIGAFWRLRSARTLPRLMLYVWTVIPFCALMAALDEFLQTFSEGRTAQLSDWLLDTSGAMLAVGLTELFLGLLWGVRRKRTSEKNERQETP